MTHQEATRILALQFPGKKVYVQAAVWINEDGTTNKPDFSVCVYDAFGTDKNATCHNEESLESAVMKVCIQTRSAPGDADLFFTDPPSIAAQIQQAALGDAAIIAGKETTTNVQ